MNSIHQKPKTIAVTGATGFVGRAITQHLLDQGHRVKLLVRDVKKLDENIRKHPKAQPISGDLHNDDALKDFCDAADFVVHCAGLTHALKSQDFFTANCEGAGNLARIFADGLSGGSLNNPPKFIHISSLAARQDHISTYAKSKRQSEDVVFQACPSAALVLRAPAMYGPHDLATLPFFKSVKRGLAPIPGGQVERRASILFVEDFVQAVVAAMDHGEVAKVYEVGDQEKDGHSWTQIAKACGQSLGVKVRLLALPKPVLKAWAIPSSQVMRWLGQAPMVTGEKIDEFFYHDWAARDHLLSELTPWKPQISLREGFERTSQWYKAHNFL